MANEPQQRLDFSSRIKKPRRFLWLPFLLALAFWGVTIYAAYSLSVNVSLRNEGRFYKLAEDTQQRLVDRFDLYRTALYGALGLLYASEQVTATEWRDYVRSLNIKKTLPGINGIGYIDYVQEDALPDYLQQTRRYLGAEFTNHPATSFQDKFIIRYIEPTPLNKAAVGLDIGFESHRRIAAERARDTGQAVLTGKIELVQDAQKQAGFLLLLPAYQSIDQPETVAGRQDALKGWVYAPFIGSQFLSGLTAKVGNQLAFRVYDGKETTPKSLIYDSTLGQQQKAHMAFDKNASYRAATTVELGGRLWTVQWVSTSAFEPPATHLGSFVILTAGSLMSLAVYLIVFLMLRQKHIIERRVHEQTEELRNARNDLLLANEELEEFSYRTSHDLRSPLISAVSLLDVSRQSFKSGHSDKAFESLDLALSSISNLLTLVEDILTLTKTQKLQEDSDNVNVKDMVRGALDKLSYMQHFDRIHIHIDIDEELTFHTKTSRLQLIIENLLSNAIKYQDLNEATPCITVSAFTSGTQHILRIEDNGLGVPADKQDQLFKMFQRFHARTSYGSGLGLYMVRKSADILCGHIVHSAGREKGAVFTLYLPTATQP